MPLNRDGVRRDAIIFDALVRCGNICGLPYALQVQTLNGIASGSPCTASTIAGGAAVVHQAKMSGPERVTRVSMSPNAPKAMGLCRHVWIL